LSDQRALAADAHVGADQQEASPIGRVREVFRVLHCGHRLGQSTANSCTLKKSIKINKLEAQVEKKNENREIF
jgi:hypothetical protein